MATLVLQTAGAALGSTFGPIGSALGRAAGALAGNAIDRSIFGEDRTIEGPRLSDLTVQESREGAPIPRVFGRTRLSGQVIWATQYEESVREEEQGGKGGPTTTTRNFSYFANFAVALCEGEISHIGRIWADGDLLDTTDVTMRVYTGREDQFPDSLIVAKQGAGQAPAYRGTAYVVFERMPIERFGNRLPQLSFEVVRSIGDVEKQVRAVQLIPAASEFAYDTQNAVEQMPDGSFLSRNRHVDHATTDFEASVEELQAVCPNLERVSLVISWFGTDLRCGECEIVPKVEVPNRTIRGEDWMVSGLNRYNVASVSTTDGTPSFGGTPSDAGVIRSIQALKARGLKVAFHPFLMMDIPEGNSLPDPYGGGEQATFPWRGRITSSIAPNLAGSTDRTAAVRAEIENFLGSATRAQFSVANGRVTFNGGNDWGFRRFILHAAHLCVAAGGVDTFVLGSEMRGMTSLRDGADAFPFVEALKDLAAEVRAVLGPDTFISYAADWSEYFGHHPNDGSGDLFFHLDPLWADPNISGVAIDNYMPLSDWREGSDHEDAADYDSPYDVTYLQSNIAGGEGFDWFYASDADRLAQIRTPITDGAYAKPWVYRYKDLVSWWSEPHFNRRAGLEDTTPTAWQPRSKPIIFHEVGFPAIDKAGNQPNVFYDPKSSESFTPYFSNGLRDDAAQRACLRALLTYWDVEANNPQSPDFLGRMVDMSRSFLWAWDARPFPAFPQRNDVWADGDNYRFGHWLNGRLGALPLSALIEDVVVNYTALPIDVSAITGIINGFSISNRVSARQALETLLEMFQIDIVERAEGLMALPKQRASKHQIANHQLVDGNDTPVETQQREQEAELPSVLAAGFFDMDADFRVTTCTTKRLVGQGRRTRDVEVPITASFGQVMPVVEQWLQALWLERDRFSFALPMSRLDVEVGDIVDLEVGTHARSVVISRLEEGIERRIEARAVTGTVGGRGEGQSQSRSLVTQPAAQAGPPVVKVLDLPLITGREIPHAPRLAVAAKPWPGQVAVFTSAGETGFAFRQAIDRPATIGTLASSMATGPVGVFDRATKIEVFVGSRTLSSIGETALFAGGNAMAIACDNGLYEIIQFSTAHIIASGRWQLSGLLRAQLGTEDAMAAGASSGNDIVLLDQALESLDVTRSEAERSLNLRFGLAGHDMSDDFTTALPLTHSMRGLTPLSPVHARLRRENTSGDLTATWMRRTRVDGDLWEVADVPLAEDQERYRVQVKQNDDVLRTVEVTSPAFTYSQADQIADYGALPDEVTLEIAQVSAAVGAGISTTVTQTF